jgi:hypothetical protein
VPSTGDGFFTHRLSPFLSLSSPFLPHHLCVRRKRFSVLNCRPTV